MGFNHSTNQSSTTFVKIIEGTLRVTVAEGTIGAQMRKNKNDKTVYELIYDAGLTGYITGLAMEKHDEYGHQLKISMTDKHGEQFVVTIPRDSKYFDSFSAKVGNVDFSKEVCITPYSFQPKDQEGKRIGVVLIQTGNPKADEKGKLPYYFTKDDPKGRPEPGEERLDEDDYKIFKLSQRKFYVDYLTNLAASIPQREPVHPFIADAQNSPDDLPF